jgi:hypothetical protein
LCLFLTNALNLINELIMKPLTSEGQQKIQEIASRYRLSENAVMLMLESVSLGGGTMAQFNISELGGGGQWMQGGMTMVGDMFNYSLKGTVNNLCSELSQLMYSQNIFEQPVAGSQSQGQNYASWYPSEFGSPSSSGGQNNMRYAYFPNPTDRLVVELNGYMTVYNTFGYNISGVSQQQSGNGFNLQFSCQYGYVDVNSLPQVSLNQNQPVAEKPIEFAPVQPIVQVADNTPAFVPENNNFSNPVVFQNETPKMTMSANEEDIIKNIERLADLHKKGILTDDEFANKKKDLLARL